MEVPPLSGSPVTNARSRRLEPPIAHMTLESFAHLATVVTLMILVYVQAKPAVNRWATIRYLRCWYEFRDDILVTPREVRRFSWARRLRRAQRRALRVSSFMLMRRVDCIRSHTLVDQLVQESRRPEHLPVMDGCDPSVAEALSMSRHYLEDKKERRRARSQNKVRCAGGCGTRFGKPRHDHDFFGGEGLHGGWLCPTTPCKGQATGDHYCGMCLEERRQASEARRVADAKPIPIDLDAQSEHPDLQDY